MQGEQLRFRWLGLTTANDLYEVDLNRDVVVVVGPMYTGKTTLLRLLDYALGKGSSPDIPELRKCLDVLVEIEVGGVLLTIRRKLFGSSHVIIYDGAASDVLEGLIDGEEIRSRHAPNEQSVSSEIMSRLGLGEVRVKTAPTKDDSKLATFSLRDLMSFVYVDQDRMGSTSGFFENNPFKAIKWRQAFEILHGLHVADEARLSDAIRLARQEISQIKGYIKHANQLLGRAKVADLEGLRDESDRLRGEMSDLQEALSSQTGAYGIETQAQGRMRQELEALELRERALVEEGRNARIDIRKLEALLVQYARDEQQLAFLEESDRQISSIPVIRCPACLQPVGVPERGSHDCHVCIQELPEQTEGLSYGKQLAIVRARMRDLRRYITDRRRDQTAANSEREELLHRRAGMRQELSRVEEQQLLPLTRAVVEANVALNTKRLELRQTERLIGMRELAMGKGTKLLEVQQRLDRLEANLEEVKLSKPEKVAVLGWLEQRLGSNLQAVHFPRLVGVGVGEDDYLPYVRGEPYSALSSAGAIGLVMAVWMITVLQYSVEVGSAFPRLVVLDSPLVAVGRDSGDAEFRDNKIVDAFFDLLATLAEKLDGRAQVVLVDNRPPSRHRQLASVAFTGVVGDGRDGLIPDETDARLPE